MLDTSLIPGTTLITSAKKDSGGPLVPTPTPLLLHPLPVSVHLTCTMRPKKYELMQLVDEIASSIKHTII